MKMKTQQYDNSSVFKTLPLIRVQSSHNTAAILQDALYSVLGNIFLADVTHTIPTEIQDTKCLFSPLIDIKESCNRVAHPVTKETIKKYNKMTQD